MTDLYFLTMTTLFLTGIAAELTVSGEYIFLNTLSSSLSTYLEVIQVDLSHYCLGTINGFS